MSQLSSQFAATDFLNALKDKGIVATGFGPQTIRFVTHLDVTRPMINEAVEAIKQIELSKKKG